MGAIRSMNGWLAGYFAFAAVHYAIQWWFSRRERVLLVFSIQCALYTVFCSVSVAFARATTIPDVQAGLVRIMTLGPAVHVVLLQFYASLSGRRDRAFRALLTAAFVVLGLLNLWVPLRGTVIALQPASLPGGGVTFLPIRTPAGAPLALYYLASAVCEGYGFLVARALWRQDRSGAVLVAVSASAIVLGTFNSTLVDFARLPMPYLGALPHTLFVLCMALLLSREYSARDARVSAHSERLENVVATRTRELREAKDEAERASRAKSRFLAHMSHEIRSPLHVMLLNTVILESDGSLGAEQRKWIGAIQRSGKHLTTIINNVLDMSKVEAGRVTLVEAPFDVGATLDEVAQMFTAEAAVNGTELTVERASDLPPSLLGDGGKVKQILINLVSNAAKFTRQGSIRVTATCRAAAAVAVHVEIVVADTGIGIAEQDRARMFQPFEQLGGGARAGGTGLGLAISLAYARLLGGDLSVESAPGVGSRFKLTFVAKRVERERVREASGPISDVAPGGAARWKVLVVDDIDANRDAVAELLARNAFDTRTAADGATGLSIHADWGPDVVLMDLRMPGMTGLEAIRRLRAAGSTAAIGALTAGAFGDDEREALRAGADFFVRKPFNDRELLDGLARAFVARGTAERE